jgi:serine/threonine protein kinase
LVAHNTEAINKTQKELVRERELLKNLNHRNIVRYLKYEETTISGKPHRASIYTEYCKGGDLVKYCKSLGSESQIKAFEAWKLLYDLASALAYCHHGLDKNEEGAYFLKHDWTTILHRDIKPANGE